MQVDVENYRGHRIEIHQDSTPENPFTNWDGLVPILVAYDGRFQGYGLDEETPALTRDEIKAHARDICALTDCRSLVNLCYEYGTLSDWSTGEPAINAAINEWLSAQGASDRMEGLCALYSMKSGYRALCATSTGYSQGDYAEVLAISSPEWREQWGAPEDEDLQKTIDLYSAYAWGDVYGFIVFAPDGEELESVWGYYGDDNEKSGLLPDAREIIDGNADKLEQIEAQAPFIMACMI